MKNIEEILNTSQEKYNKIIGKQNEKSFNMLENDLDENFYKSLSSSSIVENIYKLKNIHTEDCYKVVERHINKSKRHYLFIGLYRVAAVVAIVTLFSLLYKYSSDYKVQVVALNKQTKIGKQIVNKPILVTSTGERLVIGESNLKSKDKSLISVSNQSLKYSKKSNVLPHKLTYNTLIVPKCGLFNLTLSDGTKVWLNSETVLKYPSVFSKNMREVFIKGEAFFEVAKNRNKPFYVHAGGSIVRVLGTGFNVKSYNSEPLVTTLVHGKVEVSDNSNSVILKPGNQALVTERGIKINTVDIEMYTAWKDGYFVFKEVPLKDIFKEISDWYGFDYVFEDKEVASIKYTSKLKKFENFPKLLEILRNTGGFNTIQKGNTIYIRKNK